MARGWESKDVESQQELAEEQRRLAQAPREPVEERARRHQRESLELQRRRVAGEIERARHPRHREQLQQALAHLDAELKKLRQA
jgi:hypothetical protein